jgi:hypothetical protein
MSDTQLITELHAALEGKSVLLLKAKQEIEVLTDQLDIIVEALELLMPQEPRHCDDGYDRAMWDNAREALATLKGGSHE